MVKQRILKKIIFLVTSFIFVFFIFDTWELSFNDYQYLESQLKNRQEVANKLKSEIDFRICCGVYCRNK